MHVSISISKYIWMWLGCIVGPLAACSFQDLLYRCEMAKFMQGVPPILKFHGGWKKWRLDVGGSVHTFDSKELAMSATHGVQELQSTLAQQGMKELTDELKSAHHKAPRRKDEAVLAVLRLRYKAGDTTCSCCSEPKYPQQCFDYS